MSDSTTIIIAPESELGRALRDDRMTRVTLMIEGRRFRVVSIDVTEMTSKEVAPDDIWANFDVQRFLEGVDAAAGAWAHIDTEKMKADIRQRRELGSRLDAEIVQRNPR